MGRSVHKFQTNFTSGEADPKVIARDDVKFYYNACKELENFEVIPQGGARRRPGSQYLDKIYGKVNSMFTFSVNPLPLTGSVKIGNYSVLDDLFDGVYLDQYTNSQAEETTKYAGWDWGSGVTKTINHVDIYYEIRSFISLKFTLQGSNDNFASDVNNLGTTPYYGPTTTFATVTATDTSTAYRYHRVKVYAWATANDYADFFEFEFFDQEAAFTVTVSDPQGHGGTVANLVDNDSTTICTTTAPGTTNNYIVGVLDLGEAKTIQFVDVENIYLSGGSGESTDEFFIEYSSDNFASDVHQFGSSLVLVSEDAASYRLAMTDGSTPSARYWRLIRNGTTDLGTSVVNVGSLLVNEVQGDTSETRLIPFEFNTTQTYMLVMTDQNIAVYSGEDFITNVKTPFTSDQVGEVNWTQSADTLILVHEDVAPWTMQRDTTQEGIWNTGYLALSYIPLYDYVPTTTNYTSSVDYITPSAKTASITLTLASSTGKSWGSTDVGQLVELNGGLVRITAVQTTTVALGAVVVPLYTTDQETDWNLLSGYVDVWSLTKGWPRSVCFFEGRLWFGGSKSRPHTLWGSQVDDFTNFDPGQSLANEAMNVTLDTDQINAITQIYPGKNLQVFTTGAEFYLPQTLGEPITPSSIQVKRQTSRGSKEYLRVVEVEGGTMFIQRGGSGVREYLYNELEQGYDSNNIALLSSHLLNDPIDFSLRRANDTNEADQLLVVNTDGSMAVCCTLRSQNITAWVPWSFTSADIKNAAAIRGGTNPVYVVSERTINSSTERYLELLDGDALSDLGLTQTITSTGTAAISGLSHLEGETVAVFINGVYQGTDTVSSGSTAGTYSLTSGDSVEVGYYWVPTGETMPVTINAQGGSIRARLKRPVEATFFLYDSDDMQCNGNEQAISAGTTGQVVFQGMTDYTKDGAITFSQPTPGKLTILGIDVEVSF